MGLFDQLAEVQAAATEVEVVTSDTGADARWSGPYDITLASEILRCAVEMHGGEGDWEINAGTVENSMKGRNRRLEPRGFGAVKTKEHSSYHPGNIELYNGNGGPKAYFNGFTEEEVKKVFAEAKTLAESAETAD